MLYYFYVVMFSIIYNILAQLAADSPERHRIVVTRVDADAARVGATQLTLIVLQERDGDLVRESHRFLLTERRHFVMLACVDITSVISAYGISGWSGAMGVEKSPLSHHTQKSNSQSIMQKRLLFAQKCSNSPVAMSIFKVVRDYPIWIPL